MTRVKICGITNAEDAALAVELGAHALGFIFYEKSPRYVAPETARAIIAGIPPLVVRVGVFVNADPAAMLRVRESCGLDCIQVHADDPAVAHALPPAITIAAFRIRDEKDVARARLTPAFPLLDRYDENLFGGTGRRFDWTLLKDFGRPYILAGGITPETIGDALALKPFAVDIASGVEAAPGKKDHKKMFDIFRKLRENPDEKGMP